MKRIGILFLIFVLVFMLAACGAGEGSLPDSAAQPGGEREIVINPGEWELTGTLTLPAGEGPFPVVIFVHGSGPSDRDETVGRQKLFRDLAGDLAELGVASIRYDKRTYLYGQQMASMVEMTVAEETVEDVLHAVALAQGEPQLDAGRIYVAGHSMGGYLIPRIDEADAAGSIAGYISLAGNVRSIMTLMLEQIDYLLGLEAGMSEADKAAYRAEYETAAEMIAALTEADRGKAIYLMGACPSYWLDLADYRPDEAIKAVEEPMLFLQGEHDYQVTMTDFALWQAALDGEARAAFISYPTLTHTFTATDKMSRPADYEVAAKVDGQVARDIAGFIAAQN